MRHSIYKLVCGLELTVCLTAAFLISSRVLADDNSIVDQINITVSESCTLSGVGMDSHVATLRNRQYSGDVSAYENGIGKTTLTAFCNDYNGFSIYAVGFTGDTMTGPNHTKLVGVNGNDTISTAVYSSSDTTSSWAMKLTKVTDGTIAYIPANMSIVSGFGDWHVVPDTYTKVAQYHANTGSSATDTVLGGKLETTYAAFVSASQPADTYEGQVKYTLVHPYNEQPLQPQATDSGKICYYANAGNTEGTMGCQSITTSVTSATLLASNFSRTGYGFAGWSNKFDYTTNTDPDLKFYGPQEEITFTAGQYTGSNPGLSLYAVWIKSEGSIQDQSKVTSVCNALVAAPFDGTANLNSVSALTDQRDDQTYAIAKLADGKCWMIENLRLEAENTRTSEKQALAQGYGTSATYGNFGGLADAESVGFSSTYSANSLYSKDGSNNTINIGSSSYPYARMPRYNNWNNQPLSVNRPQNPTSNSITNDNTHAGMFSHGNYYTWHAAIADTSHYPDGDHNTTSICPSGWMIPLGNVSTGNIEQGANDIANKVGGFSYLDRKMGGTGASQLSSAAVSLRWRRFPLNYLFSGYFTSSSVSSYGVYGYYWSSTARDYDTGYYLQVGSISLNPGASFRTYNGYSVRCVASS